MVTTPTKFYCGQNDTPVQLATFQTVSDGKKIVANAITDKGIETAEDATFATMADNISAIPIGPKITNSALSVTDSLRYKITLNNTIPPLYYWKGITGNEGNHVTLTVYPAYFSRTNNKLNTVWDSNSYGMYYGLNTEYTTYYDTTHYKGSVKFSSGGVISYTKVPAISIHTFEVVALTSYTATITMDVEPLTVTSGNSTHNLSWSNTKLEQSVRTIVFEISIPDSVTSGFTLQGSTTITLR